MENDYREPAVTAWRTLDYVDGYLRGRKLLLELVGPYRDPAVGWVCKYTITADGEEGTTVETRGGDSLQALVLAIQGMVRDLKADYNNLSWCGGPRGEIGLPFFMLLPAGTSSSAAFSTSKLQLDVERAVQEHEQRIREENERFFDGRGSQWQDGSSQ
jgi:hypothetical protein